MRCRASRSLWDKELPKLEDQGIADGGRRAARVTSMARKSQDLRLVERPVDLGADGKFLVTVAGDATEIFEETRAFELLSVGTFARADRRAAADDDFPGAVRSRTAEAHLRRHRRHPFRPRRAAGGRVPGGDRAAGARDQRADRCQSRDRRTRAHPCRQSRARDQDAAVGDRSTKRSARRRSVRQKGARTGRGDAQSGDASSGARAHRRAGRPSSAPSPTSRR